jgi:hypothetical protein
MISTIHDARSTAKGARRDRTGRLVGRTSHYRTERPGWGEIKKKEALDAMMQAAAAAPDLLAARRAVMALRQLPLGADRLRAMVRRSESVKHGDSAPIWGSAMRISRDPVALRHGSHPGRLTATRQQGANPLKQLAILTRSRPR